MTLTNACNPSSNTEIQLIACLKRESIFFLDLQIMDRNKLVGTPYAGAPNSIPTATPVEGFLRLSQNVFTVGIVYSPLKTAIACWPSLLSLAISDATITNESFQ